MIVCQKLALLFHMIFYTKIVPTLNCILRHFLLHWTIAGLLLETISATVRYSGTDYFRGNGQQIRT